MRSSETRLAFGGFAQIIMAGAIGILQFGTATPSRAQTVSNSTLVPADRQELGDEEYPTWTLAKLPPQTYMNEIYFTAPSDIPAFFRDSLLQIVGRSYYLKRDNFNDTRAQAWTGGGWIAWRSGLIANMFGVHVAAYTSQKLFGPDGEGGSKLLTETQDPINVIGQAYGRVQIIDNEIRGGRMLVDTPLINPQDNRMVPNTFEGVQAVSLPDSARPYDYALGYLVNMKPRDSNDFVSMSDALAGGDTVDRGTSFAMLRVRPAPGLIVTFNDYYTTDFVNTAFGQVEYNFQLPKDMPKFSVGVNVIDQRSVGMNLLAGMPGAPFDTFQASGKVQMTWLGWTLFVAGSITGDQSKIFNAYGTKPNYTDMQQVSFDNANEKAIGGSIAYDFGAAWQPLAGLSAGAWYTQGWDAINSATLAPIADRKELDLWLQYRPGAGPLKGFRLKVQYSEVWQQGNVRDVQPEFRFIVDYTVLFRPLMNVVERKG